MYEALLYAAIRDWGYYDEVNLLALLRERAAVLLAGARTVTEQAISSGDTRRPKPRPRAV